MNRNISSIKLITNLQHMSRAASTCKKKKNPIELSVKSIRSEIENMSGVFTISSLYAPAPAHTHRLQPNCIIPPWNSSFPITNRSGNVAPLNFTCNFSSNPPPGMSYFYQQFFKHVFVFCLLRKYWCILLW